MLIFIQHTSGASRLALLQGFTGKRGDKNAA